MYTYSKAILWDKCWYIFQHHGAYGIDVHPISPSQACGALSGRRPHTPEPAQAPAAAETGASEGSSGSRPATGRRRTGWTGGPSGKLTEFWKITMNNGESWLIVDSG